MEITSIINEHILNESDNIKESFCNAKPYKHILLKDFLNASFLENILTEFPKVNAEELINEFGGTSKKHAVHDVRSIGKTFRDWDDLLKSPRFITWIESITGIDGLIYDPEYHGAGTHNNLHGQGMDVHVDFNLHRTTGYHRRLNLIVYLNEDWDERWGGGLSVHENPWEPEKDWSITYPPFANNVIIFETNEYSWHGFEEINLPENKRYLSRKSLTVYYYSKERPIHEIAPKHGTIYVQKPMPKDIKPNEILTAEQYQNLQKNFSKRNRYLKALYDRETKLSQRIENQKFYKNQVEKYIRIPIVGFAKQIGEIQGIMPNLKVANTMSCKIKVLRNCQKMKIIGEVPSYVNGGENQINIEIDSKQIASQVESKKRFVIDVDLLKMDGEEFNLTVNGVFSNSPFDVGINNDKKKTAFKIDHLLFE